MAVSAGSVRMAAIAGLCGYSRVIFMCNYKITFMDKEGRISLVALKTELTRIVACKALSQIMICLCFMLFFPAGNVFIRHIFVSMAIHA